MGPEILYFDELFQRNWKLLSIKLESPTLLQSILYNIDIYIQLDILTYKAPKKVPKMAIWVSHPNGPVPIHGPCYLPEKSLPAWPGQCDTEIFPGKAVAEDPYYITNLQSPKSPLSMDQT